MKCPGCGSVITKGKQECDRCGALVPPHAKWETPSQTRSQTPDPAGMKPDMPEWRKEVSEKVRAYGERKRSLLTPPRPIKEEDKLPANPEQEAVSGSAPTPPPEAKISPSSPSGSAVASPRPVPATAVPASVLPTPGAEIWTSDLEALDEDKTAAPASPTSLYLGRRVISWVIDNTILIVLYAALLFTFSYWIDSDVSSLGKGSWPALLGVFLLAHCLYYVYFYSTSRQTPGQVFVALELRDPLSSRISLQRILVRWLSMVILNVLNFIPLISKKNYLLLDQFSGTEIRSLK